MNVTPRSKRKDDCAKRAAAAPARAASARKTWTGPPPASFSNDGLRAADTRMIAQLRPDGSLRHLLTLEGLERRLVEGLIERAQAYLRPTGSAPASSNVLA